jgi:hypothetical protein
MEQCAWGAFSETQLVDGTRQGEVYAEIYTLS